MIVVCGDFHGDFAKVNQFLAKKPEITTIFQCGDFGYFPRFHNKTYMSSTGKIYTFDQYSLKNKDTKILFCPGNHEDWEELLKLENNEIMPNVFYMKRNSMANLPDGRKVLFMGGGFSIDRDCRVPRSGAFGWFWEETITQKDIEELPNEKIDIIISHTAPNEFVIPDYHKEYGHDPSRDALSYTLNYYKPKLWYFGHMHTFKRGIYNGCRWTCLSGVGMSNRWWIPLEK